MPYNNLVSRTGSQALVPEHVSNDILTGMTNDSVALQMFKRIPMSTGQTRMPILSALPTAYFVNGDTGLKQTTEIDWSNKYLNAEELAAIVPVPEAVMDDIESGYDLWGSIKPLLQESLARALDAAVIFGVNKPSDWPTAIVPGAVAAGAVTTRGTNAAAAGGIAGDFSAAFAFVETSGYDVNGVVANTTYKGILRQARTTYGQELTEVSRTDAYGVDIKYPMRGLWPTGSGAAEAVLGDWTQGILGTRQDITYKILDQAVIQDSTGAVIYNLAQQDMVALRVVMRVGFQVANILTYDQPNNAVRYPFAVIEHP